MREDGLTEKTLRQVASYKTLTTMDEVATYQISTVPIGGVAFAQKGEREEKDRAREQILSLFDLDNWPSPLYMLTMPGAQWSFERKLLGLREPAWLRKPKPWRTHFTSCESNRSLYFNAVAQMPGLHNSTLKYVKPFSFAERAVKTAYAAFFFANIDDFMRYDWERGWDAAWLDYTGPLTTERLLLIEQFYCQYVRKILIVTALKSRWNATTSETIKGAGGYFAWLRNHLQGSVLHEIEYYDTAPMAQFAITKRTPLWAWE